MKFVHKSSANRAWRFFKRYAIIIVIAIILAMQIERLVSKGTFFGYKLRSASSKTATQQREQSGSILGGKNAKNKDAVACKTFTEQKVGEAIGSKVTLLGSLVPDRNKPNLVSNCLYKIEGADGKSTKTVSILVRDLSSVELAQKTVKSLKSDEKGKDITGLADEAYFNTSANQLTVRKGKRLVTVTVPKSQSDQSDNKDTAIAIAKSGI